jgi:hypothetical protein
MGVEAMVSPQDVAAATQSEAKQSSGLESDVL